MRRTLIFGAPLVLTIRDVGHDEQARYPHRAKAWTDGRSKVHQSSLVYLSGLQGEYDGYWHVIEVRHEFNNEYRYRMHLELGTESLGIPVVGPPENGIIIPPAVLTAPVIDPDPILVTPPTDPGAFDPGAGPPPVVWGSPVSTVDIPQEPTVPPFVRGRGCCVC